MTFWPQGKSILVRSDDHHNPQQITWRGYVHQVERIEKSWRVDVEWWNRRTWRHYFRLRTDTHLLVELYQDIETGAWFLQREFD
jgi:hypothetical protein